MYNFSHVCLLTYKFKNKKSEKIILTIVGFSLEQETYGLVDLLIVL